MEENSLDLDLAASAANAKTILRLEGVNKWFHRGTLRNAHVLKDINLEVTRGEVLVVIGPSGSGKSTLLRCINFVAPPETGTVVFLGRKWTKDNVPLSPIARLSYERELNVLRTHIGMVFQHFNLFPHMTALQNVTLGLTRVLGVPGKQARERAMVELERLGLGAKAKSYPSQLSGGQKQRVAIARALAMKPQLMLFDEVTSALDPELIGGILEEMKKLALEGMTMIVVTHEMGFAREVGDRLMFMDEGAIVEEGPAREVIKSPRNERTQAFLRAIL
ncbi:MAG: amino acid ABC transporter ATP-binding protein [Chloroflexi bacterium]|nr:MAG: amino acid ABC transporter ATP-binding protein [Chloroflexota bacterium]TMG65637.1 MAG: amino acid ABC transporter ATP-binding protein [Chloroflexota bacterium]